MKSTFQTIILIIFGIGFLVAVAVFSGLFGSGGNKSATTPEGAVYVWGVIPSEQMAPFIDTFNSQGLGYSINYEEHKPETIVNDLVNTLADNNSPDVIIYSSELLMQLKNKLYKIPYAAYAERSFRDVYIDGARLYLDADGVIGMPLVVDPLVVYYNKDILAGANFVVPPKTWGNLSRVVPLFTKRNAQNGLLQSTVALGESDNVNNMTDILSTLFLQTGNSIVSYDPVTKGNVVTLSATKNASDISPTSQALTFYTSFSNPTNTNYSWNKSISSSLDNFLMGKSAFYIGRASELFKIQQQNPNLNFDVQEIFQPDSATRNITYGSYIGASVLSRAPNFTSAYAFLTYLSSGQSVDELSKSLSLPPARKDLLLVQQNNPYINVFFKAALSSFAWPDPNPAQTKEIFRDMITNVSSGRLDPDSAIYEATQNLQSAI
jgi:ABC-type glycerol-3-phosphate transport system substrate-binding protein